MLRLLKAFIIFFFMTSAAWGGSGTIGLKAGSWNLETQNIQNPETESSGVGAYSVEFGYSFLSQILFVGGFNILLSDIVSGSSAFGIDIGAKYYPISNYSTWMAKSDKAEIRLREVWRPYAGFFIRQRLFNIAVSTSYIGPGVSLGLDYAPYADWFFSLEYRYDLLYGSQGAEAQQTNIMLGLGFEI